MKEKTGANLSSDLLHLGCGLTAPEGWLNVDVSWQVVLAQWPTLKRALVRLRLYPRTQADIPWPANILRLDLRKPLPFPDDRFVAVYSSHTLEHLFYEDAVRLLKECCRVLKPGGICRIVVPDLRAAVTKYVSSVDSDNGESADRLMEELLVHPRCNQRGLLGRYRQLSGFLQHKWMYDARSLKKLLEGGGFAEITSPECLEGRLPDLQAVEDPERIRDGAGIVAEGVKP